jgi:hypothetical protein
MDISSSMTLSLVLKDISIEGTTWKYHMVTKLLHLQEVSIFLWHVLQICAEGKD